MRFGMVLLALLLVACNQGGEGGGPSNGHDLTGSLALRDPDGFEIGACAGSGGYSDIAAGTQVTVKNGDGTIIATGELEAGDGGGATCTFPFTVESVPDSEFYSIEVGHRGALNYSKAELADADWNVDLSLGN